MNRDGLEATHNHCRRGREGEVALSLGILEQHKSRDSVLSELHSRLLESSHLYIRLVSQGDLNEFAARHSKRVDANKRRDVARKVSRGLLEKLLCPLVDVGVDALCVLVDQTNRTTRQDVMELAFEERLP